jgi:hypothetical protein
MSLFGEHEKHLRESTPGVYSNISDLRADYTRLLWRYSKCLGSATGLERENILLREEVKRLAELNTLMVTRAFPKNEL